MGGGAVSDEDRSELQQELAYKTLRQGIVNFRFAPGERIVARDLCEELEVGRTPVRESIVRLQQEGFVVTRPKSGSYVSRIDLEAAECARYIRSLVERDVAATCCSKASPEDVARLNALLAAQERACDAHDQRAFFDADNSFHAELYAVAGRSTAWAWLEGINVDLTRYRWLHVRSRGLDWASMLAQHRRIRDAVAAREPAEASFLLAEHLHVILDERDEIVAEFPDYFKGDGRE